MLGFVGYLSGGSWFCDFRVYKDGRNGDIILVVINFKVEVKLWG